MLKEEERKSVIDGLVLVYETGRRMHPPKPKLQRCVGAHIISYRIRFGLGLGSSDADMGGG